MPKLLILKYSTEYIIAMGDTIDCVPLINYLSQTSLNESFGQEQRLLLLTMQHTARSIRSFFPVDANLDFAILRNLHDFDEIKRSYGAVEVIAAENDIPFDYQHFEIETLYKKAGLLYAERDKWCTIKSQIAEVEQLEPPTEPYAFIPEGGSPGKYKIDRKYVSKGLKEIIPPQDAFMLSYAKIIEHATEIHCHPTSWPRLIEKLPTRGKLFMHHYVRPTNWKPENWRRLNVIEKEWLQIQ
jgi:hypothetical protein